MKNHAPTTRSFTPGSLYITPGAAGVLSSQDVADALERHCRHDWGIVDPQDRAANDRAVVEGTRILSAYRGHRGTRFWIITEADRSATTVLLPDEY